MFVYYFLFAIASVSVVAASSNGSADSTDTYHQRAIETYNRIIPCLENSRYVQKNQLNKLAPPADAKEHYLDLLEKTRIFRDIPYHNYHYAGPWIENHYINYFMNKPFEYFNGFVPLFIQFVDIHVYEFQDYTPEKPRNMSIPTTQGTVDKLKGWLRKDVVYLVVSQDDQGIGTALVSTFPNILVFSAGGYGHIPIPLIAGEKPFVEAVPGHKYGVDVGFYGNPHPGMARGRMLREVESCAKYLKMSYRSTLSSDWIKLMLDTKFNLCPRGFGRTSIRLAEVIQSGRIPVFVFDDERWIPYEGSSISIETYGYVGKMGQMRSVIEALQTTTEGKFAEKLAAVKAAREYFTYPGVIKQIEAFIQHVPNFKKDNGEEARRAGVYLRCEKLPMTDHRRTLMGEREEN